MINNGCVLHMIQSVYYLAVHYETGNDEHYLKLIIPNFYKNIWILKIITDQDHQYSALSE